MSDTLSPEERAAAWAASDTENALVEIDRVIEEEDGLRGFIEIAWPTIEKEGTYKSNWHIDAICEHLQAVSKGELRRLLIAIPPRHMKSVATAIMWPAWDWIANPARRFLFSSYAHNLSMRDSARCRRVVASHWYRQRWGDRFAITSDQNTKQKFENDKGGYRLSTSVGGQLTGEGGDVVVVDDPHNVQQAESAKVREGTLVWWDEAMSSRLNDPATGSFVIIQQRVHEHDLIGHILKKDRGIGDYTYLCLPAEYEPDHPQRWFRDPRKELGELLWPERVPRKALLGIKSSQGPYAFAGQYQQRPAPREGGLFKASWFPLTPDLPHDLECVRGWDLAATEKSQIKSDPDYTACAKVGWSRSRKKWIILDIRRWRASPHEVRAHILALAQADGPECGIVLPQDPGQAGKSQAQDLLAMLAGYPVHAEPQTGDKLVRATPLAGQAGVGNIQMVAGDWNKDFLAEITGFPTGAHDDQVDALSSAFNRLTGGALGIAEYYARQLDEATRKKAEQAELLARNGGTLPGLVVVEDETTDMARALLAGRLRPW